MENIIIENTNCYTRASEYQIMRYRQLKKQEYELEDIENPLLRAEIFAFVSDRCERLSLLTVAKDIQRFGWLIKFINEYAKSSNSILENTLEDWERKYKILLSKNGIVLYQKRKRKDRDNDSVQVSDKLSYFRLFYHYIEENRRVPQPEYEKDVWDVRKLDIMPEENVIRKRYTLDFREIVQEQIRNTAKQIIYSHCSYKSFQSVKSELWAVRKLACFLQLRHKEITCLEQLDRKVIEEFIVFLKTESGLCANSYNSVIHYVDATLAEWAKETENYALSQLFLKRDTRTVKRKLPEGYSDNEIRRFNQALKHTEPQIMRCLILHQILGTRIEDVLTLSSDCVHFHNGQYYVNIFQNKVKRTYRKPINEKAAMLLRAALQASQEIDADTEYVFLQTNGSVFTDAFIQYRINSMIRDEGLYDDCGNVFEFKTHKFRHTYGIKHAELDIDDKHIADLLGHKDTRSVHYYRRVRNRKLAEETREIRDEMNEIIKENRRRNADGEV